MPAIRMVEEDAATNDVKEIYGDICNRQAPGQKDGDVEQTECERVRAELDAARGDETAGW